MSGIKSGVLKLVVVGHVDHGKSTVIGRLLLDTGSLPEGVVEKARGIARETGQPFEYAYLLDAFEEEQKQGITIDTTQIQFRTAKREYVIIDAPGHKEFLRNMISGAAGADAAFLIIDAGEGVREQSKRHAYILSLLGIRDIYVIVNKMDLVGYSREVYETIRAETDEFLKSLEVRPIDYLPASGYKGDNILSRSENLGWFSGKSIIEAMEDIESPSDLSGASLRLPIQDVYKFDERRIIAGRVEMGSIKAGDEIRVYPSGRKTHVKSLVSWAPRDETDEFRAGQSIGITLEDEFFNRRGEIIARGEAPSVSKAFRANLFWMGTAPAERWRKYRIKIATGEAMGEISEIRRVVDASTLEPRSRGSISMNDVAEVTIEVERALAFDRFADCAPTGRFVVVDGYDVSGGGIIIGVESRAPEHAPVFEGNGLSVRCDIFREFYFNLADWSGAGPITEATYGIGQKIPASGESFAYPADFDMICVFENAAVAVRNSAVSDIMELDDYRFSYNPLVNGLGFAINASDPDEFARYLEEARAADARPEKKFFDRWLRFERYRTMIFNSENWSI